jgi:threonine synthase
VKVSNGEILDAQRILARKEGIFAEPSGVTALAGLIKLGSERRIPTDDCIVVEITGSGLKDLDMIGSAEAPLIDPNVNDLEKVLGVKK